MHVTLRSSTAVLLSLALCALAGCQKAPGFSYTIDPSLAPSPATLGDRPLARLSDPDGLETLFVANAVLVRPAGPGQLDAVLKALNDHGLGAHLAGDDAVPDPPPTSKLTADPAYATPTTYLIELDPTKAHAYLDGFATDAGRAGFQGRIAVSGVDAAALLAVTMHLAASGVAAGPDFVATPDGLTSTAEAPDGSGGNLDAFTMTPFLATGSRSDVVGAWRLVDAAPAGSWRRVGLVILDGGF